MSIDQYTVVFEEYTEKHYISRFRKKYHKAWDVTLRAIEEELKRVHTFIGVNNKIEVISHIGKTRNSTLHIRVLPI